MDRLPPTPCILILLMQLSSACHTLTLHNYVIYKGRAFQRADVLCSSVCLLVEIFYVLKCQYSSKEWFTFGSLEPLRQHYENNVRSMATKRTPALRKWALWSECLDIAGESSLEGPFYNNEWANSLSSILTDRSVHQTPRSPPHGLSPSINPSCQLYLHPSLCK